MKKVLAFAFGWARVFRSAGRAIREARTGWAAARIIRGIKMTEALIVWDGKDMVVIMFGGDLIFEVGQTDRDYICGTLGWKENGKPAMRRLNLGRMGYPG